MNSLKDEDKVSKSKIGIWLPIISLAWCAGAIFLLLKTSTCPGDLSFLDQYLSCRSANELGDFLAGLFAPLAFIWLAGAVIIQSQELTEQRIELKLTRETIEAQVTEMKAQAAYLGEQTNFLKLQTEDRKKTFVSREITHCLGTIQRLASAEGTEITVHMDGNESKIPFASANWAPLKSLLVTVHGLAELAKVLENESFELASAKLPLVGIRDLLSEAMQLSQSENSREGIAFKEYDLSNVLSRLDAMIGSHPEICLQNS